MGLVTERTFSSAMERIGRCADLTVDLETTGLRPYLGDRLFGVAVEAEGAPFYFPFRHKTGLNLPPERLTQLLDVLVGGSCLGGHNFIRFDCPMIAMEGDKYVRALLHDDRVPKWDTMIDAMMANENEPSFSLENLGNKYLGDSATKHANKEALLEALKRLHPKLRASRQLYGHMSELPPELVAEYACGDVLDSRALHTKYAPHLEQWGLAALTAEMCRYARLLAKIERRGLLVDKAECARRIELCEQEREEILARIRAIAGPKLNPQSWQQVMEACGTPDGKAETIEKSGHPLAKLLVGYKQRGKVASTYYGSMLELADAGDIIHPQMNLTRDPHDHGGTRSCRLSCSNPNFQNLPVRSPDWFMRVREVVMARPGHTLLKADYERAEMWMGAHYSGDEALDDAYYAGRDLYKELAARTGTDRQQAKIDWLSIQYGIGAEKISKSHGWPFKSVRQLEKEFGKLIDRGEWGDREWRAYKSQRGVVLKDEFFAMCPGIKDKMRGLTERAETWRYLRLWTGRVIHFDGHFTLPFSAWNRLIQGGVGEMVRVAMQKLEQPLEDVGASMLLQVHDELVVETPEENRQGTIERMDAMMCDFNFRLQPRIEVSAGQRYGLVEKEA